MTTNAVINIVIKWLYSCSVTIHVDEAYILKPRKGEILKAVFICTGLGDPHLGYDALGVVNTTTACHNDIHLWKHLGAEGVELNTYFNLIALILCCLPNYSAGIHAYGFFARPSYHLNVLHLDLLCSQSGDCIF